MVTSELSSSSFLLFPLLSSSPSSCPYPISFGYEDGAAATFQSLSSLIRHAVLPMWHRRREGYDKLFFRYGDQVLFWRGEWDICAETHQRRKSKQNETFTEIIERHEENLEKQNDSVRGWRVSWMWVISQHCWQFNLLYSSILRSTLLECDYLSYTLMTF